MALMPRDDATVEPRRREPFRRRRAHALRTACVRPHHVRARGDGRELASTDIMHDGAAATTASSRKIIAALNALVETCVDAQKGYATASADVRRHALKEKLLSLSSERERFGEALQRHI